MQQQESRKPLGIKPVKKHELFTLALKNWASYQVTKKTFEELSFESASKLMMKPDVLKAAGIFVSNLLYYGDANQQQKNIIGRGKMLLTSLMISAMKTDIVTSNTDHDDALELAAGELVSVIEDIVSGFVKSNFECDIPSLNNQLKMFREKYKTFSSIFIKWREADKDVSLKQLRNQSEELEKFKDAVCTKFQPDQVTELVDFAEKCNKMIKARIEQFGGNTSSAKAEIAKEITRKNTSDDLVARKKLKMSVNDVEIEYDPVLVHEFIVNPKANSIPKSKHFLHSFNRSYLKNAYKTDTTTHQPSIIFNSKKSRLDVFLEIVEKFRSLIQKCIPDLKEDPAQTEAHENAARKANFQNKVEVDNFLNPDHIKYSVLASKIDIKTILLYVIDKIYQVSAPIRDIETKTLEIEILNISQVDGTKVSDESLEISSKILNLLENVYFDLIGFYLESSSRFGDIHDVFSTQRTNFLIEKERDSFELKYRINTKQSNKELFIRNMESNIPNTVRWLCSTKNSLSSNQTPFISPSSSPNSLIKPNPRFSSEGSSRASSSGELDREAILKSAIVSLVFEATDPTFDSTGIETLALDKSRLNEIKANINSLVSIASVLPLVDGYFDKKLFTKKKIVVDLVDSILYRSLQSKTQAGNKIVGINEQGQGPELDIVGQSLRFENELIENLQLILFDSIKANRNNSKMLSGSVSEQSGGPESIETDTQSLKTNTVPENSLNKNLTPVLINSEPVSGPQSQPQPQLQTINSSIDETEQETRLVEVKQVQKLLQSCRVALKPESPVYKLLKKRLFEYIKVSIVRGTSSDPPSGFSMLESYISQSINFLSYFSQVNYNIYSRFYNSII